MLQKNKNLYITIGILVLFLLFSSKAIYTYKKSQSEEANLKENQVKTGDSVVNIKSSGDAAIKSLPLPAGNTALQAVMPNLDRPIVFSAAFPKELQANMIDKIKTLSNEIKKDPTSTEKWLQLAINWKIISDYNGAREIWEYLAKADPKNFIPLHNLGDLYTYYLKDATKAEGPVRAESYFLKALELAPSEINTYRSLYDLYRYVVKDDIKAKAILQQGVDKTASKDLKYLLDTY